MRRIVAAIAITAALELVAGPVRGQQDSAFSLSDVLPVILVQRTPSFPFASWQNYAFGTVVVRYVVDTNGAVAPATIAVVSSPDTFMARAVRKTIRETRFRPGIVANRPAAVQVEQAFVFDNPQGHASTVGLRHVGANKLDNVMRAESVEVAPVALFAPPPRVPDGLRVTGTVRVRFIIDTAGRVEPSSVRVLNSPDDRLSDAVAEAVMRERFRPATVHGKPVRTLVEQPYTFKSP